MNKKKQMQFNLNNFLLSLSTVLDFAEGVSESRSKRVAFLGLKIAEKLGLRKEEMFDLCAYSLVLGIPFDAEKTKEEYEKSLPFLSGNKNISKAQNLSQILFFSKFLDEKFDLSKKDIDNRKEIITFLEKDKGTLFSKELVDTFLELSSYISFWLDIQNENDILYYIFSTLPDFTIALDFEDILNITTPLLKIIDKDTRFLDMCEKMCDFYEFEHKDKQTFLIAASLHKIGKLAIDSKIINKSGVLNENEYEIIKAYPYYTKRVLSNIMGFADITNWACRVQERLDGSGYPFKLSGKDLSLKDRLMAILVIYYALISEKNYRKAYSQKEAFKILRDEARQAKLDKAIVEDVIKVLNK